MPRNPIYSTGRDAQNMGVNTPAPGAEPKKSYIQSNNNFNLTYKQGATLRYGDVHPFFVMDGLPADRIPFESLHSLRSYTLQAPLENELYMHKSMTMVPMKAILPNTWDRFIVNPTKGDDVPDDVYCNFDVFAPLRIIASGSSPETFVKAVMMAETIFSRGSLLANLKIDFSSIWLRETGSTFDDWFDTVFIPWIKSTQLVVYRELGNGEVQNLKIYDFGISGDQSLYSVANIHTIFECLRDACDFSFYVAPSGESFAIVLNQFKSYINTIAVRSYDFLIDISRPAAYQLSCVACLTDDSIDNIYTDKLYLSLFNDINPPEFFEYNGELIQYDVLSANRLNYWYNQDFSQNASYVVSGYYRMYSLLFGFRRSLKFSDYFIDARPEPYSVGAMSAEVRDGMVSAVDMTVSILRQRFLNWSNRVGNKIFDYIKSLTGVNPSASNDETKYIIHETFPIRGFEVENTGSEQRENLTVTTLLKTEQSKYLYDIELTDYCVLIGLCHFDMERMYIGIVDRLARKSNRFDFFNKFFQYSGDQDISRSELNAAHVGNDLPLAYTTRHMQYKTSVNHATGGFATNALPGWLNTSDFNDSSQSAISSNRGFGINSEFIRNHSEDFDKFYSSLTGVSLGNYFHFSVKFVNQVISSRQMAIAPDIL